MPYSPEHIDHENDDDDQQVDQEEEAEEEEGLEELEIMVPGPQATAKQLRKVLADSQLKHSECFKENQRLKKQVAALEAGKHSRRRTQRNLMLPQDTAVKSAGRHFATCYEAWANIKQALESPASGPSSIINSASRYTNKASELNALRHELDLMLPSAVRALLHGDKADQYRIKFDGAMSEQRSNAVSRVSQLSSAIFGPLDDHKRNSLLKSDPLSNKYDSLPPVFYRDHIVDSKTVFRSEEIILAATCILHGASSLETESKGRRSHSHSFASNTVAHLWGLTEVTPGLIAFVATVVRFVLSGDPEFGPVGASGINYKDAFKSYKALIINHIEKDSVKQLFDVFNSRLFPSVAEKHADNVEDHEAFDMINKMLDDEE